MLRATTACVFSISTSTSALNVVCFVHFDLGMCFAPQWHALFQHLNFQKCSEPAALASLFSTLRSHKSLDKHSVSRLSYLFAHLDLLSSSLLFSDSSHLCFSSVHLVGSLTSKLPSTKGMSTAERDICNLSLIVVLLSHCSTWTQSRR